MFNSSIKRTIIAITAALAASTMMLGAAVGPSQASTLHMFEMPHA